MAVSILTCVSFVHLVDTFIVDFKSPRMRAWNVALFKFELLAIGVSTVLCKDSLGVFPVPVRRRWTRVDLPGLQRGLGVIIRLWDVWTNTVHISTVIFETFESSIVVFGVIPQPLARSNDVLVA